MLGIEALLNNLGWDFVVFNLSKRLKNFVPIEGGELLSESTSQVVYTPRHLSLFVFWVLLDGVWVADFV